MTDIATNNINIVYKFCSIHRGYAYLFGSYEDFVYDMVTEYYAKICKWAPQNGTLSTFINKVLINYIIHIYKNQKKCVKDDISLDALYNSTEILEDSYEQDFGDHLYYSKLVGALSPIAYDYYVNKMSMNECLEKYKISRAMFYKKLQGTKEIISKIVDNYNSDMV